RGSGAGAGAGGDRGGGGRGGGGRGGGGVTVEIVFLPGLGEVLADEVMERLSPTRPPRPVPGRHDALRVDLTGPLDGVLRLRTAVAAYVVRHFDVPRPRSLTSGDHLARIVDAMYASLRVGGSSSFRFEAAGADSVVFTRLAALLREATGLAYEPKDGELVVRVIRTPRRQQDAAHGWDGCGRAPGSAGSASGLQHSASRGQQDADPGWDVLVRLGPRPLSARRWRVADFPGAANATIAAAMTRLAGIRPDERVLNLMCGSGTLLIERLASARAAIAVGVDDDPAALEAARANLRAAGLRTVRLVRADATSPAALAEALSAALAELPGGLAGTLHGGPAASAGVPTHAPGRLCVDASSGSAERSSSGPAVGTSSGTPAERSGPPVDPPADPLVSPPLGLPDDERFDLVLADPPWGTLHGSHESAPAVHAGLLAAAHAVTTPGGRLVVLTHEVRVMERAVADAAAWWTPAGPPLRVFAKGHHPRIWVLRHQSPDSCS
ncbi:MAG: methyltransferase, partial [Micrococcales bacterium]|nr:methyltransferase [Micrococcales bacterium]